MKNCTRKHKFTTLSKVGVVVFLIFFYNTLSAQTDSLPIYKQFPTVPPFKLVLVSDSSIFSKDDLRKKQPVIVMVFSPDCDHCKHAVEALLKYPKLLKKAQIILSSSLGYGYIKKFYEEKKLQPYPTIKVGFDPNYFLGTFYGVKTYPSVHVYDKKGKLKSSYEGSVDWAEVQREL